MRALNRACKNQLEYIVEFNARRDTEVAMVRVIITSVVRIFAHEL